MQKSTTLPSFAASQGSRIGVWRVDVGLRHEAPFELDLVAEGVLHVKKREFEG